MKVGDSLGNHAGLTGIPVKDDKKLAETGETSFKGKLQKVENQNIEERIHGLVTRIFEQGEKLGKKTDIRELKVYKKLISEFLDEAVNNSHRFSKKNFLDRRGRHKVFALVKKVNEELENLTKEVLSAEKENINILQRVDGIKGLILDIVL